MNRIFYTLFLVLLLTSFAAKSDKLKIGYPEFKPYTYTLDGEAKGNGVEIFSVLANKLSFDIEWVPVETHGNGFARLNKNVIDAVLLATQNPHRDQLGRFSAPIANNIWSWFLLKQPGKNYQALVNDKEIKVGTLKNTNTHNWLLDNDYHAVAATNDLTAMLRQIHNNRIQAIFISERVLKSRLKTLKLSSKGFYIHRQVEKPLGVYISHQYLDKHPQFINKLNQQITKLKAANEITR